MFDLLSKLISIRACPGREHNIAQIISDIMKPLADECSIDVVGNIICFIRGDGENKKKLLYAAHTDEVGMIVTKIDNNGFIRFTNNGFPNWMSTAFRDVVFESGAKGMVIAEPGSGTPEPQKMYVDIGARSRNEALKYVNVGDTFSAEGYLVRLAGSTVAGRPIDNRIGCAVLISAAEKLKKSGKRPYNDIYFVFTAQEETALPAVGGSVASFEIQPDIGIAVDVCATGDTPGAAPVETNVGGGTVVQIRDSTIVFDYKLVKDMIKACEDNGIFYQRLVTSAGGTDAVPMQKIGRGCRAGAIGIPMRYLHTSAELCDLSDAESCVSLVLALCDKEFEY